jgi:hypothetical protein
MGIYFTLEQIGGECDKTSTLLKVDSERSKNMGSLREVAELVTVHKRSRPEMRARDVYKLLFQGIYGVGHLMGPGVWDYLQREAKSLDVKDQPSEALMESVSVDGSVVRVNLRPFIAKDYPLIQLMDAMRNSEINGKPSDFLELWDNFVELVWSGQLDFDQEEVSTVNKSLNRDKPQPMHHTQEYRDAYHPAYRVILKREVLKITGL